MLARIKNIIKEKVKNDPFLKKAIQKIIFRRSPFHTHVRWYIWVFTILPKYFNRCVNWSARLDLVPFNSFKIGKNTKIEKNVIVNNGMGDVEIQDEVQIGIGSLILGPVKIGKHTGLSQYVRILGMHHGLDPIMPHHHLPCSKAPVELGEDVFVGTGTVILGKKNGELLKLGDYCRIGANSVVTTDIPPYSIAVGNPAKVVRVWDHEVMKWVKAPENNESKNTHTISLAPDLIRSN